VGGVWQTEIYPQRPQSLHEFQAKSIRDLCPNNGLETMTLTRNYDVNAMQTQDVSKSNREVNAGD